MGVVERAISGGAGRVEGVRAGRAWEAREGGGQGRGMGRGEGPRGLAAGAVGWGARANHWLDPGLP